MPNYKTHAIHGDILFHFMNKRIFINKEDFKTYCYGYDTLISSDFALAKIQHEKDTRRYFETIIKYIKDNNLQFNSEVMAYLYGQIDHVALDIETHPLIYYMTENIPKIHLFDAHALLEHEIDNYIINKYQIEHKNYYKWNLNDPELKELINKVYRHVYHKSNVALKYELGLKSLNTYDSLVRKNKLKLTPFICTLLNTGHIAYNNEFNNKNLLNLKNKSWQNPETGIVSTDSFDDLWNKSIDLSLETIEDINKYLYDNKELKTRIITDNLSANTGLSCNKGQINNYAKQYSLGKNKKNH